MGAIFSNREAVVVYITLVSVALLLACFPSQPTGKMTASSGEKARVEKEPEIPQPSASFSAYEIGECLDELAVYKKSVKELVDIVTDKCDTPHRDFERAALEVARSHNYSEDEFDCNDFSRLLVENLGELGYGARIVHGYYKGEPHAWVVAEIPIEATSGNLITPQHYSDYAPSNTSG